MKHLGLVLLAMLLSACGAMQQGVGVPDPFAIPRPFAGDGDQQIISEVLGERSVYLPPVAGLTPEADAALRKAIVTAAEQFDVLVSAEARTAGSLTLAGKARGTAVDFALYDGEKPLSQFTAEGEPAVLAIGAARSLASAMGRFSATSAPRSAAMATPAAYIREITAPNPKQAEPLKRAISAELAAMGVRMMDGATTETYVVTGAMTLGPDQDGKTGIVIIWKVYSPDGRDLGQAEQNNALPTEAVRKAWAEQASLAGGAAASSVAQIIATDFNKPK